MEPKFPPYKDFLRGKKVYPITPLKGAARLRAHAHLNGITLHAPLTNRKVEASSPGIRVTNQVKFTLFAANLPK